PPCHRRDGRGPRRRRAGRQASAGQLRDRRRRSAADRTVGRRPGGPGGAPGGAMSPAAPRRPPWVAPGWGSVEPPEEIRVEDSRERMAGLKEARRLASERARRQGRKPGGRTAFGTTWWGRAWVDAL